jgi:hypothetical protein
MAMMRDPSAMERERRRRRRRRLPVLLSLTVVLLGIVALGTVLTVLAIDRSGAPSSSKPRGPATSSLKLPSHHRMQIEPWTLIATLTADTPTYADASSLKVIQTLPAQWLGAPQALPVIQAHNSRLEVRLLQRPNGSTAWISSTAAQLTRTQYHVVVDLTAKRLLLFDRSKLIMNAAAGVGAPPTPTPAGAFFMARLTSAPSPTYGPFVIMTSAFSTGITDWRQGGVAMVTINGPLGTDAQIDSQGAAITTGSIRLHNVDLARLGVLPLGAPIDVEAKLLCLQPKGSRRCQHVVP